MLIYVIPHYCLQHIYTQSTCIILYFIFHNLFHPTIKTRAFTSICTRLDGVYVYQFSVGSDLGHDYVGNFQCSSAKCGEMNGAERCGTEQIFLCGQFCADYKLCFLYFLNVLNRVFMFCAL